MVLFLILIPILIIIAIATGIISFYLENIIAFSSVLFGITAGIFSGVKFGIHPAICLIIGIVTAAAVYIIQQTKVGFWLFAVVISAALGFVFAFTAYALGLDMTWFYVLFGLATIFNLSLHIKAGNCV